MDDTTLLEALERHWDASGGKDPDVEQEIYHHDAVLEFPQSGERFEGVKNFKEWRAMYPADLKFHIRKITRRDDLVVAENLISYGGRPWMFTVNLMYFTGEKIAHERIYIMDRWEAAEWRTRGAPRRQRTRRRRLLNSNDRPAHSGESCTSWSWRHSEPITGRDASPAATNTSRTVIPHAALNRSSTFCKSANLRFVRNLRHPPEHGDSL